MTLYHCTISTTGYAIVWYYEDDILKFRWMAEKLAQDVVLGFDWIWFPVGWRY